MYCGYGSRLYRFLYDDLLICWWHEISLEPAPQTSAALHPTQENCERIGLVRLLEGREGRGRQVGTARRGRGKGERAGKGEGAEEEGANAGLSGPIWRYLDQSRTIETYLEIHSAFI